MTYRLLVTDLDGTLLAPSGEVHERDRDAILALLKKGVGVSLCTGRMYSGTRHVAEALGLDGPVGCVDGSHIVEARSHKELLAHVISAPEALVGVLAEFETTSFVFAGDVIYHDAEGAEFLHYVSLWSEQVTELERVLERTRWSDEHRIAAVVSLGTEEQIKGARAVIEGELGEAVQAATFQIRRSGFSGSWGMVVRAAGVNKGTAIEWIAAHHGVQPSEVVVVGDWLNDVPMMKAAGRSFAMAQAPEPVKAAASDVLQADTVRGGGIAEAAERAGLL